MKLFFRKNARIIFHDGTPEETHPSINAAKRRSRELQKQGWKFSKEPK